MDIKMLYIEKDGKKFCRLCEWEQNTIMDNHAEECPGKIIDGLTYEIRVEGPNCSRGCCGYTDFSVSGQSLEEAIINAEASAARSDCIRPSFDVRMVCTISYPEELIEKARTERKAREAAEEAKKVAAKRAELRAARRDTALKELETDRPDLTPEGYERRKSEIERLYGGPR